MRTEVAFRMSVEAVTVFNACAADGRASSDLLKVTTEWIDDAGSRSLVLPLLRAASTTVTSLPTMLNLTEACVDAHFVHGEEKGRQYHFFSPSLFFLV